MQSQSVLIHVRFAPNGSVVEIDASIGNSSPLRRRPVTMRSAPIRRDPVPEVKELEVRDQNERDAWTVAIGVVAFALAIVIITFGVASAAGWSPAQYVIHG